MDPADLAAGASESATEAARMAAEAAGGLDPFMIGLTVFALAVIVGYYVVWRVTPALHSPLLSVTNAISSVIIVGALVAAGPVELNFSKIMGFIAVTLASVNIFGGFIVTQRMLQMFKKKPAGREPAP
jgi:NAD(P) transhydrogenase subunit alpha